MRLWTFRPVVVDHGGFHFVKSAVIHDDWSERPQECIAWVMREEIVESTFTAVFEQVGGWYVGYVEELPGANTQGQTIVEARENLREAIQLILLTNRELDERELGGKDVLREEITVEI